MSTDAIAGTVLGAKIAVPEGLRSPPDSNNALNLDDSDSELSDIEEDGTVIPKIKAEPTGPVRDRNVILTDDKDIICDIAPACFSDDGTVPIFKPTMAQFEDFQVYVTKLNKWGSRTGIVKVIPPKEWLDAQPPLEEAVKSIKINDPIKQTFFREQGFGRAGAFRQTNELHQRSYNLPQWRQTCDAEHNQPPADRGKVRAKIEKPVIATRKRGGTSTPTGSMRRSKKQKVESDNESEQGQDRLPTPDSPSIKAEDGKPIQSKETEDMSSKAKSKAKSVRKAPSGRMGNVTSVSSRRKYAGRSGPVKIDEAAFKDFDYQLHGENYTPERCQELENNYWKGIGYASPFYGADLLGSLFTKQTSVWNLDELPNLLDVLNESLPGVNTAYLYFGMWKSTFAWHLEDVDLYSINYLHFGAPKQWYAISQKDAPKFEKAMKSIWPEDAKTCSEFLRHKTFMTSPKMLKRDHGITVNKVTHHPGEFVITFPYGYHSGFNLGYNCAEAVNFGLPSWLPMGRIAKKCDCVHAQDSVFIDVSILDRKLNGEPTPEYETEAEEEEEEEDGPTDLPTPPGSSGDVRLKLIHSKHRRPAKGKDGKTTTGKKIRIRFGSAIKEPCCLCPHEYPSELLPTEDGRKAHLLCAEYIPETWIEDGVVVGLASIDKARLELKCVYCHSRKGAAFQCSQKKCARAYHATCAAAAGVFVEQALTGVFAEGKEYITDGIEFSCRFHRTKRDKKVDAETLGDDETIRKAASELAVGAICQFQFIKAEIWAGVVVANNKSENLLTVDVVPKGSRVEVDYRYLLLPTAGDYQLPPPSANAIPMPTSRKDKESLVTSKRQENDLPRKDDIFGPGFKWDTFVTADNPLNAAQVKVDFSKANQILFYLGKNSTEAKAQYTEDILKPRHNPACSFLETVAKAVLPLPPRHSFPASYPSASTNRVSGSSISISKPIYRPPLPHSVSSGASRSEKPYIYKPKIGSASYHVDQDAYRLQQDFLQQSTPQSQPVAMRLLTFGSDPRWRPADERTSSSYSAWNPPNSQASPSQYSGLLGNSTSQPQPAKPQTPKANNPFTRPVSSSSGSKLNRSYTSGPDPFVKYPYLQKQHNRSALEYKSPYSQSGGFMNGYEGDLVAHLKNNPEALRKYGYQTSSQVPQVPNANPLALYSTTPKPYYAPILPPPRINAPQPNQYAPTNQSKPQHTQPSATPYQSQLAAKIWEKKDHSQLHPAIRQEFNPMFHQQYPLAPPSADQAPESQFTTSNPVVRNPKEYAPILPPAYQSQPRTDQLPTQFMSQKSPPQHQLPQSDSSPNLAPIPATTVFAQAYQDARPTYGENRMSTTQESQPIYPHQQYFQKTSKSAPDLPDVPTDSTTIVEQVMANLRRHAGGSPS